jgi:hypothetical protein
MKFEASLAATFPLSPVSCAYLTTFGREELLQGKALDDEKCTKAGGNMQPAIYYRRFVVAPRGTLTHC